MLVNQGTAISTSGVLLVPYEECHVPTYHDWMKDEEIQAATASEPLSLGDEYAMQQSWRADHDKLTFIACLPVDSQPGEIVSGIQDSPNRMIGDVNLFLSAADEDPEACIGELELMIACPSLRRRGHGRATVLAFLHYIAVHLQTILDEYKSGQAVGTMSLLLLKVKIGSKNEKSIKLFESVGFIQAAGGPNYFDEIELALEGPFDEKRTTGLLERYGIHGYIETPYVEPGK